MALIDTHAHVYVEEFDEDRDEMIRRSKKAGIDFILMPAIDTASHSRMLALEDIYTGYCIAMMGLHPCSVKENYKEELKTVEDYFTQRKFIAVGETGLDFYWDLTFKEQQYDAFRQQIGWARHYDIPVVIHSRNSIDECIDVISEQQDGKLKGVFHCFFGTVDQAKQIIDQGFYLGIGGVLSFKNAGLDAVVQQLDLSHIVLETDAPYLAPVPFRGKRNESSYIFNIAQKLSEIKKVDIEEIGEITSSNAQKLFGL